MITTEFMWHKDGTLPPDEGWVFVFGSNLAGVHGAGAAAIASRAFGATWGAASGRSGNAYAIPTKDVRIANTLPLSVIVDYIEIFGKYTHACSSTKFFVTRVACGLAGLPDSIIAPVFFKHCNTNCSFADSWRCHLPT